MKMTCPVCLEVKEESKFRPSIGGGRKNVCARCQAEVAYVQAKTEIFKAYGSKCACCGETNPLFLQLDHVNNDGRKHRHLQTYQIYRLVKKLGYPDDFQLLCGSCNWAKGHWGVCPHQSGRTTEVVWAQWESILARKGKRYRDFQEKLENPNFREERFGRRGKMLGNKCYPKTRGAHGRFSKAEVAEVLQKIEMENN